MSKISVITLLLSVIIGNIYCEHIVLKFKTNLDLDSINENNYIKSAVEQQIYVEAKIGESKQVIPMTLKTWQYPTYIISEGKFTVIISYSSSLLSESPEGFFERFDIIATIIIINRIKTISDTTPIIISLFLDEFF